MKNLYDVSSDCECCTNEMICFDDYGRKMARILAEIVVETLNLNYGVSRTLILEMFAGVLYEKLGGKNGLLKQYLHSQLDEMLPRFKSTFNLPEDISINYEYATHAKFADVIEEIHKKFKEIQQEPISTEVN